MTEQEMIKTARDVLDGFNENDWERSKGPLALDSLYSEVGTQQRLQGPSATIQALQGWKQAMPDVTGTVTNAFATGNMAVLEVTWEGTHTGPLQTPGGAIPASGKPQVTPSAWVFEFDGDKIKESRNYFDMLSMMQQIGALPQ